MKFKWLSGVLWTMGCGTATDSAPAHGPDPGADTDGETRGSTASSGRTSSSSGGTTGGGGPGSGSDADPTTSEGSSTGDDEPRTHEACFAEAFVNDAPLPDYDQYAVVVGDHCLGTDHQDVDTIDRVVFLGDSVTVGTPPSAADDYYRTRLALMLADRFGLDTGPAFGLWKTANFLDGTSSVHSSGDFWSCAKWGGKTEDLSGPGGQLEQCFPPELSSLRTLVIMTMGGNDFSQLAQAQQAGASSKDLMELAAGMTERNRAALQWLTDADRFENGNAVVFANIYEFTDATGDTATCEGSVLAPLIGFDGAIQIEPEVREVVAWMQEEYASMAVDTQTDFIFLYEEFCGHGFSHDDPTSPCYRGPDSTNWFDFTCIHPNPVGHGVIADMFFAVVDD